MRSRRLDVYRVERLACRHKQAIAPRAAEAHVAANLGQTNHADPVAGGRENLNAGLRPGPDVSVRVAAEAIGPGRSTRTWNIELRKAFSVTQIVPVDIPDFDFAASAGVGHVQLFVVGAEAETIRRADL